MLRFFSLGLCTGRGRFWRAVTFAVEDQLVGVVPEPVDGGGAEQAVGKGLGPLSEIKVAGDQGGEPLMAFGDEVVQVLVLG